MAHCTYQPTIGSAGVLGDRRAVTLVELLVVLAVSMILLASASAMYVSSRKAGDLSGDTMKVQKLIATARSYAISSPDRFYQATFWPAGSAFWIDEIDTATKVLRPKIVAPEPLSDQVVMAAVSGRAIREKLSDGTEVFHVRFYPDGSSDDGSVYLIRKDRKEADPAGHNYQQIKIYGPTARTRLFKDKDLGPPTP